MVRKIISIFLVLFLMIAVVSTNFIYADSNSYVTIELDRTEASVGDIIKASVMVNNIPNLAGFQVNIKFDPSVLEAVEADKKTPYTKNTIPQEGTIIVSNTYGAIPTASHNLSEGIINFGKAYVFFKNYKEDGIAETTGVLGVIYFRVLKEQVAEVKFENSPAMPKSISGTTMIDWDGKTIESGYSVRQPQVINASKKPIQTPEPTATIQVTATPRPTSTPVPTIKPTSTVAPTPIPAVTPTATPVSTPVPISTNETGNSGDSTVTDISSNIIYSKPVFDNVTREAVSIVSSKDIHAALNGAMGEVKTVYLNVGEVPDAESYVQEIPKEMLSSDLLSYRVNIKTKMGTVEVPSNMLGKAYIQKELERVDNVAICIRRESSEKMNGSLRAELGSKRPVLDLFLSSGTNRIPWNNPDAPVSVSMPYTPDNEELTNPEHIVVRYVDDSSKALPVPSGKYDSGNVTFTSTHFHKFVITYVHKKFDDIDKYSWAKRQVEVLASKGVINGTSSKTFSPSADITRADFIVLLVKALGLTATVDSNFDDIPASSYYTEAVGIAKKLGITGGVGNNKFNPKAKITRQDMMVLTTNALKISGKISRVGTEADIEKFSDKSKIAPYAIEGVATLVREGIVVGNKDLINPGGYASRAELAAIIYKVYIR